MLGRLVHWGFAASFHAGWQARGASGLIVDLECGASTSGGAMVWKTTSSEQSREDSSFMIRCEAVSGVISGAGNPIFEFELCPGCSYPTLS